MNKLFKLTYDFLVFLSELTGFTYREINIIIWFYLIPFFWLVLMDKANNSHRLKIAGLLLIAVSLLLISDFTQFSNDLFHKSVTFLRSFNTIGSNYIVSSVVICLFIPIGITIYLFRRIRKQKGTIS